jgi:YHS domain-containing protein
MQPADKHRIHVDPVCGIVVDPATAAAKTRYNGMDLYFCAEGCKTRFESAPHNYAPTPRKGFWRRYLERLNKATGGKPPSCCH